MKLSILPVSTSPLQDIGSKAVYTDGNPDSADPMGNGDYVKQGTH